MSELSLQRQAWLRKQQRTRTAVLLWRVGLLAALFAALLPVLHRMGYLPDQAARLKLWKRPGWLDRQKTPANVEGPSRKDPWED